MTNTAEFTKHCSVFIPVYRDWNQVPGDPQKWYSLGYTQPVELYYTYLKPRILIKAQGSFKMR